MIYPVLNRKCSHILRPFLANISRYSSTESISTAPDMDTQKVKREHETIEEGDNPDTCQSDTKYLKVDDNIKVSTLSSITHGKGRFVPQKTLKELTEDDINLLENVKTSCTDLDKIRASIKLRRKHHLAVRLPEDIEDAAYYIQDGLRKVYPYHYLYQTYAKRRWLGRKLKDVLKQEFRDITEEQLRKRFETSRILVNGESVAYDYVIRDNDFITNRNHRHELPVLATPIKIIHEDKDTLVIDKPPSMPIHPCGRYRHNSVVNILEKEYKYKNLKVVHRLDRLVSGVLITAKNSARANVLETMIKNRDVQKEYVCRVEGEFPLGKSEDNGYICVDQPLDIIEGKIGITVVDKDGKPSITKFKRLNYNGKSSTVSCLPLSGRMHQIRVHLQYLGHPIVNDGLYNSDAFGPEKGKCGNIGKSYKQLSMDVIALHRASSWLMSDGNDVLDFSEETGTQIKEEKLPPSSETVKFLSAEEREETMTALEHFFTNESWKDLERRFGFDESRYIKDPACSDCNAKFYDPPLRRLFLYLHAYRYSGTGWSYQSEMPVWARDTWKH